METACPRCMRVYNVPESAAGKLTRCKRCEAQFTIKPLDRQGAESDNRPGTPTPQPHKIPKQQMVPDWIAYPVSGIVGYLIVRVAQYLFTPDGYASSVTAPFIGALIVVFFVGNLRGASFATPKGNPADRYHHKNQASASRPDVLRWIVYGVGGVIAALIIGAVWWGGVESEKHDRRSGRLPAVTESDAYVMAQIFVEKKLKSPATADFPTSYDANIKRLGGNRFQVVSWVDSQNAFGAVLRTKFICELHTEDGQNWTCDTLVFDE